MKVKHIAVTFAAAVICAAFLSGNAAYAAPANPSIALLALPEENERFALTYLSPVNAVLALQEEEKRIETELQKQAERDEIYANIAFAKVDKGSYLNIRKKADVSSTWVGRLYAKNAAKVIKKKNGWLKIQSGDVIGYVKAEHMVKGEKAVKMARKMVKAANPDTDIDTLEPAVIKATFVSARSKKAIEEESKKKGADLVTNASQYVGNPYRWGGLSLTKGIDCSGFVKVLYAQYGVSLPHSSAAMRRVGREVEYTDIRKGDIVCYKGHVGIYAGDGKIVNAIDDEHGIGYSSVNYAPILTIRRIF